MRFNAIVHDNRLSAIFPWILGAAILLAAQLLLIVRLLAERRRLLERERSARELRDAEKYLAQTATDRSRIELVDRLAHDLRNPMAPLLISVEMLRELPVHDERVAWASETISRQVTRMATIIDDLQDFASLKSGKVDLRLQPVDLVAVAREAAEACHDRLADRSGQLELVLPERPLMVRGDPARLRQAIAILVGVVARRMEPGRRGLRLSVRSAGTNALLTVSSNVGGPEAGEPFTREDFVVRPDGELGLSLIKEVMARHGGSLLGRAGVTGELTLRLLLSSRDGATAPRPARGPAARPRRILIADDNVDGADSLRRALTMRNHVVEVAHDGHQALRAAERLDPEVALLDIDLPLTDGLELARRLRARPGERRVLLIAVTGLGRLEDRMSTNQAGFDHHLVKPVDLASLEALLGED